MKPGKIIWSVVLLCCVALGVWQRQNLSTFWREYHALWRDYDYQKHKLVLHRPIIPENIARTDPEAVAVINGVLRDYYEGYEHLPVIAENLLKFPDNEFLLFSCASEIFRLSELDQGVVIKLAERLIDIDKDNSLYHCLKATSILANEQSGDIKIVLDEINTAAGSPNFYFPYSKYSSRTMAVAEKAKLHLALTETLSSSYFYAQWLHHLPKVLLRYASRAFTNGEIEKGLLIDDAINSIGKNQFDAGCNGASVVMDSKSFYTSFRFGYWSFPEMLELQRADITEQRARRNRLQLCSYALQRIENEKDREYNLRRYRERKVTDERMIFTVPVALFNGRMLFTVAGVWLVLVAICMVRGWSSNQKTGIVAPLLFAGVSLCYFLLVNGRLFFPLKFICLCSFGHPAMMRPEPMGLQYVLDVPMHSFVFLILPILTALLLWFVSRPILSEMSSWLRASLELILTLAISAIATVLFGILKHFTHGEEDLPESLPVVAFAVTFALVFLNFAVFAFWLSEFRLVRGILAAMPLGVLAEMASPYAYICWIPFILYVAICVPIVLDKPPDSVPFIKALRGVFGKKPESVAIRSRAVKLLAPFIVIHWLLLVASVPTCVNYLEQLYSNFRRSYPKLNLAPADETSYQQVLARFDSNDFTISEFEELIPLVMPEDLPAILEKCKSIVFSPSYPFKPLKTTEVKDVNAQPAKERSGKKLSDWNIITAMDGSGRDGINILANAMENPEREYALVSRAKLGDVRVKKRLEQLLVLRFANSQPTEPNENYSYEDRPEKSIDIICALACISKPSETGARFMDYVARGEVSHLVFNYGFCRGIPLLPTTQAREVVKAYLAKAKDWQPRITSYDEIFREDVSMVLGPVREASGTYVDKDISEAVYNIMLHSEDKDVIKDWGEPWEIPQDFDMQSADLLRQGLASKNDQLRAWCVWQLRKVGYKFGEDEISQLLADESWQVRANAVIAGGLETAGRAAKDTHPFVRWVASFVSQSPGGL